MQDHTSTIEQTVQHEHQPKLIYLLRMWLYVFRSAKAMSLLFLGLMLALSVLRPVAALLWGKYIDLAAAYLPGKELIPLILLVLLYYGINFLTTILWRYTESYEDIERVDLVQSNRFQELVQSRVLKTLASVDPEYWEVPKMNDTADRTFRFLSDKWEGMSRAIMLQGYLVISKLISVISIALSLYIFNPWLCLIVLIAPLPSLYTLLISEKLKFKFVKENSKLQRRANYYQDILLRHGAKEVKTIGLFDFFFEKWKQEMDAYTTKEKRLYRNQALISMVNDLVASAANIGANILAISLMAAGSISLGALGACLSLIDTLLADTKALLESMAAFLSKKNEAALFYDLIDLKKRQGDQPCESIESIAAQELKYRYPLSEQYVLNGIDCFIKKGEKVALVGENGAGKTSFVKLLSGILSASDGALFINQQSVHQLDLESRFHQFSTVSQMPARYHTFTVAQNVYLGDTLSNKDDEKIAAALKFCGLDGTMMHTMLGKEIGGTDLSGGQWQKLAIARAVYRNRDFIILDEPTSNLDPLAETEIFQKYMELANDKTVVFVTHRISVAALAQRIIVFDHGRIAEEGTHQELLARDGKYAKLYREQAKWYDR